jgi:hypothetical protein
MIAVPLGIYVTKFSGGLFIDNLADQAESVQWTISDTFGFESCAINVRGTVEDVLSWFTLLSSGMVIYGPDAEICWEGFLNAVDATIGQEAHSRSLDAMANLIRVRYTTVLGSPGVTADQQDTTSQTTYRVKHGVERLGQMTSTAASTQCTRILNDRRWPGKRPSSNIATGEMGDISITLHFVGWYGMLDWLLTTQTDRTSAVTTTQLTTLLTAFNAINGIFSTDTTGITASGLSDSQFIADDTTYRAAIERLLQQGNSSGVRYAWGVYDTAKFWAAAWAGSGPSSPTYQRSLGGGLEAAVGGRVNLWNARPNVMYQINEMLDLIPNTNEPDAAGRYYVARTSFEINREGMSLTLEPSDTNDVSAQIARFTRNA